MKQQIREEVHNHGYTIKSNPVEYNPPGNQQSSNEACHMLSSLTKSVSKLLFITYLYCFTFSHILLDKMSTTILKKLGGFLEVAVSNTCQIFYFNDNSIACNLS